MRAEDVFPMMLFTPEGREMLDKLRARSTTERCSCDPAHGAVCGCGKPMCAECCFSAHPTCPCSCFHCTPEQGVIAPCTCKNGNGSG